MKLFLYYCLKFIGFVLLLYIFDTNITYGWVGIVVVIILGGIGDDLLRKLLKIDDKCEIKVKRTITKEMMDSDLNEKWNQYVDLLAMEEYEDLSEIQKVANLCFWYDSKVQNGGYLQYFLNRGTSLVKETEIALINLDAQLQSRIYVKAINILQTEGIFNMKKVEEYVKEALEEKFDDLDSEYYNCVPTIQDLLEIYLEKYEKEFLIFENSTSFYILETMNFKSDRFYKIYIKDNIVYGAKIAGQFFEKEYTNFQLSSLSMIPWVKNKIKERYELENQYDNSELDVIDFLNKNKHNFIIETSEIKQISIDNSQRLWTWGYPNQGTIKIETNKNVMKFIIIGNQDIISIKQIFSDLGIYIKS